MKIDKRSLVVLCGAAGSGKSTFAESHFSATEIVSSDRCRAIVSDDEGNMAASKEAFDAFYYIIEKRMKMGRLVAADSTAVTYDARKKLLKLAKSCGYNTVLVVFDLPLETILSRNNQRERKVPEEVIKRQYAVFSSSLEHIFDEGFDEVAILNDSNIDSFELEVQNKSYSSSKENKFDIIADIHGCFDEFERLLSELGYMRQGSSYRHGEDRRVIFAGDILDGGPKSIDTANLVMNMVSNDNALYIPGNHCNKLYRYFRGKKVHIKDGLETTISEYENLNMFEREKFKSNFIKFYEAAPLYLVLDDGRLVVAHAGICDDMIGKNSKKIEDFVLFGPDNDNANWISKHKSGALIVYGHKPVLNPEFINNTIDIDQGAREGGSLAALRYPENNILAVKSSYKYYSNDRSNKGKGSNINFEEVNEPLYLKIDDGDKIKIEYKEVLNSINQIKNITSFNEQKLAYIPPVIPSINSYDIYGQCITAFSYYKLAGIKKVILQPVEIDKKYVIILCNTIDDSRKYFSSNGYGEIYSQYNSITNDRKLNIIEKLHSDFLSFGYFEKSNIDFIVFEAVIFDNMKVMPIKIICTNRNILYNKESMWQLQNISHFSEYSDWFINNKSYVCDIELDVPYISDLINRGLSEFLILPAEGYMWYHGNHALPAVRCSSQNIIAGEGFFELSSMSHMLSGSAVEKFIKGASNDYYRYTIGTAAINNRIIKMRM